MLSGKKKMKRGAIIGFALVVLFLFSIFPAHVRAQEVGTLTLYPTSGSAGSAISYPCISTYAPYLGPPGGYVSFGDKYFYNVDGKGAWGLPTDLPGWYPTFVPADAAPGTYTITDKWYTTNFDNEGHILPGYNLTFVGTGFFTVTVPTITLDPAEGKPGSTFKFTVSGFPQNDNVSVEFGETIPANPDKVEHSPFIQGNRGFLQSSRDLDFKEVTTDSSGNATGSLTVPEFGFLGQGFSPGRYNVTAGDHLTIGSYRARGQ